MADLVIDLEAGRTLAGVCFDEADGTPVPGVTVAVGSKEAVSDAEGIFEVAGLAPAEFERFDGRVRIAAQHDDYEIFQQFVPAPDEAEGEPLEIRLRRARRLTGRVIDRAGAAVSGARVRVVFPGIPEVIVLLMPGGSGLSDVSAEDGTFTMALPARNMAPPGSGMEIVASHPVAGVGTTGPVPWPPEPGTEPPAFEVTLSPGGVVAGAVTGGSGEAVRGARVYVKPVFPEGLQPEAQLFSQLLKQGGGKVNYTGPEGTYRVEGLRPGDYTVEARAMGYAVRTIASVAVTDGEQTVDIQLEAGGAIEGRVVDETKHPLARVEITAFLDVAVEGDRADRIGREIRRFRQAGMAGSASARSDAAGRFKLENLPEGSFSILARAEGFDPAEVEGVRPGQPLGDIILARYGAIEGTVTSAATGAPVAAFQVRLVPGEEERERWDFSRVGVPRRFDEPSGQFLLENVPAGSYTLHVTAEGLAPAVEKAEVWPGRVLELGVVLEAGFRVEGVVVEQGSREPIVGVQVSCRWGRQEGEESRVVTFDDRVTRRETATDENGAYVFEGLLEGTYTVTLRHPYYYVEGKQPRFTLPDDDGSLLETTLKPGGVLAGSVRALPAREPQAEYEIKLYRQAEPHRPGAAAKDRSPAGPAKPRPERILFVRRGGTFRAEGLEPGTYAVEIRMRDSSKSGTEEAAAIPLGSVTVEAKQATPAEFELPE
jgi:protocatechuate 3,4-dioxygenase beta subunit